MWCWRKFWTRQNTLPSAELLSGLQTEGRLKTDANRMTVDSSMSVIVNRPETRFLRLTIVEGTLLILSEISEVIT